MIRQKDLNSMQGFIDVFIAMRMSIKDPSLHMRMSRPNGACLATNQLPFVLGDLQLQLF